MISAVPSRYIKLGPHAEAFTGYTVKAMERKIERGDWVEGREWKRAPDGCRFIIREGFEKWVGKGAGSRKGKARSASTTASTGASASTP